MLLSTLKIQLSKIRIYHQSIILNLIFSTLAIYVSYSLYSLLHDENNPPQSILLYTILSTSISQSLATIRIPEYCQNIKNGLVSKYYKYPLSVFKQFIIEEFGISLYAIGCVFPLFVFAFMLSDSSYLNILLFAFSLLCSTILAVILTVDIYSLSFLLLNYKSAKALLTCVSGFLSGSMIPLSLLPEWFRKACYTTPFAYMVDAPISLLQSYQIDYSVILTQLLWILVLLVAGTFIFKAIEPAIVVNGG